MDRSLDFRSDESPLEALIRLIAVQCIDISSDEVEKDFVCHEDDLHVVDCVEEKSMRNCIARRNGKTKR